MNYLYRILKTFGKFSEKQVLADAAEIEIFSSYPLAKSIVNFAQQKGITFHEIQEYQSIVGKGAKALCLVCYSLDHCVGNLKLVGVRASVTQEIEKVIKKLEAQGKTVVLVSEGDKVMGALAISDVIREEAFQAIKQLDALGVQSIILSGDNLPISTYVAQKNRDTRRACICFAIAPRKSSKNRSTKKRN